MAEVPVGDGMLGRVVNALGEPIIDNRGPIAGGGLPKNRESAPSVIMRRSVNQPLQTGIGLLMLLFRLEKVKES